MRLTVYRKSHFNAAHRIYNPAWDDAKNEAVFGLCSNPYYHGHNYEMEVALTGEVDAETGYVYDLGKLQEIINQEVVARLDHKNLNVQVPEFKQLIPTAEHICYVIYGWLRSRIEPDKEIRIRLWETPRNSVTYPPEGEKG